MAKVITKTTVKMSSTNNRVALTINYPNGEVLKAAVNRGSDTMNATRPNGFNEQFGKLDLKILFKYTAYRASNESPIMQMERLAKFFETTTSIQDAINKGTISYLQTRIQNIQEGK